jgi:tetratricopeptide (TPR) repeat protein
VWVLCIWQALVLILAGLCYLIGAGTQVPVLSDAEQRYLESLVLPTNDEQQQSLSEVNNLLGTHQKAVQLWQEAIYQLLDGRDAESVLSKLKAEAPRTPKFYDNYTRWLLTEFWRKTRGELIITAAGYGCTNENILSGIESLRQEPITEKEAAKKSHDAKSLALILQSDFTGAAKSISAESGVLLDKEQQAIASALSQLEKAPGDFKRRLELAESLIGFARTGQFTVGYASYCWNLWAEANTIEQRAAVLSLLGHIYERDEHFESSRLLYSAGVRLSSGASTVATELQALLLERAANAEREASRYLVAASLYQKAAEISRDRRIYGTSQFNRDMYCVRPDMRRLQLMSCRI